MIVAQSLLLASLLGFGAQAPKGADPQAWAALKRFDQAWKGTKTLTFVLHKEERLIGGKTVKEKIFVKLRKPGEVYLGNLEPKPGLEVIYSAKRNPTKLTAHQGSFPDVTVNLSIGGSMATKDQHHLVVGTGYALLIENLRQGLKRAIAEPSGERLEFAGEETLFGRPVVRVISHAGNLPHAKIKAPADESLLAFARRVKCAPYLIAYYNDDLDELSDDVDEGDVYTVPQYYGKKVEMMLDKKTGLSLRTTTWDFEGNVFERYEHRDLEHNPKLTDADFDPDNPHYGF